MASFPKLTTSVWLGRLCETLNFSIFTLRDSHPQFPARPNASAAILFSIESAHALSNLFPSIHRIFSPQKPFYSQPNCSSWWYFGASFKQFTVESRYLEHSRETKNCSKQREFEVARVSSNFILLTKPITDGSNLSAYVRAVSALCHRVPNEQL